MVLCVGAANIDGVVGVAADVVAVVVVVVVGVGVGVVGVAVVAAFVVRIC